MSKYVFYIKRKLKLVLMMMLNNAIRFKIENKPNINKRQITTKIKNNFKLVSIHIPKTAGTSLYKIICEVYDKKSVARLDYKPALQKLFVNEKEFNSEVFPPNIEVVHGHINPNVLMDYFELGEDVKIITWLRDPVERIISDYYYLIQIIKENYNFDPYNPKILDRMTKSLIEFARMEMEKNRMTRFLGRMKPEDMFFVGTTENFDRDLKRLAQLLNWGSYTSVKVNKTKNKSTDISPEIIEEIRLLNKQDIDLYNKALEMNNK